jgi:hypothetical protein
MSTSTSKQFRKHKPTNIDRGRNAGSASASSAKAAAMPAAVKKPETKHSKIVAMLRSPSGATIPRIMKETGWQQHSVRGFLAGVVRKKLGLNLISSLNEGQRIYQIKQKTSAARKGRTVKSAM